tara:strand:+ start:9827 stop:10345 length:519 start_codon:yes stop_codon:yes gene_type:complete
MAKNDNVLGVIKIGIGASGDGIMGASLTDFTDIELNSVNFAGAESNEETIPTESEDSYLTIGTAANPTTITFRLFGVTGTAAVLLLGGEFSGSEYKAPESVPDNYLSIRLTSRTIGGFYHEIEMPYARISARHEGSITKSGLLAVEVTATANTPVSALAVKGAPYTIRKVAV